MKEKNKSKNVGGVTIIFIIGILIIALICCAIYMYRIVNENLQLKESINNVQQQNQDVTENSNIDFIELSRAAKKHIEFKLNNEENKYEYDFNDDNIKEVLEVQVNENTYELLFQKKNFAKFYIPEEEWLLDEPINIYIIDLDKKDHYLDFVLERLNGTNNYEYFVFKNQQNEFELLNTNEDDTIGSVDAIIVPQEGMFYLNENSEFYIQHILSMNFTKPFITEYYKIEQDKLNNIENENKNIALIVKNDIENTMVFIEKNTVNKNLEYLKDGTEVIIKKAYNKYGVLEVELYDGREGYLFKEDKYQAKEEIIEILK